MKRILVDMDDTVASMLKGLCAEANLYFDLSLQPEDFVNWDFYKCPAVVDVITPKKLWSVAAKEGFYQRLLPIPNAVEMLHYMAKTYEIVFVSSPLPDSPTCVFDKEAWLVAYMHFPYKTIFTRYKYMVQGDLLIDDGGHNVEEWDGPALIKDSPHNQYLVKENTLRFSDWKKVPSLIKALI